MAMKNVSVQYFAALREQRGLGGEKVSTEAGTAEELFQELAALHGLTLEPRLVIVAIRDEFVPMNQPLSDGDELLFMPPLAGG